MLVLKAFHLIALVAWFAGLFYLPRLFVYHADAFDEISQKRFVVMERRLYYGITWPAGVLTTALGLWLITYNPCYYLKAPWMQAKINLVLLLWVFHLACGYYLKAFAGNKNTKSALFYRVFNEVPTLFLIAIVLLVELKPA
jgi:putative membrane protein